MAKTILMETVSQAKSVIDKTNNEMYFEGIFGLAGKRNLNGRLYPMPVMEKAIKDYNEGFVNNHRACLELDHPEDASINLRNIACVIEEPLTIKENGEVWGRARVLKNTPMGKITYELFKEGVTMGISSRGLGEISTKTIVDDELGEEVEVNEVNDFSLAAFDLVSEPSIGMFVSQSKQEEAVKKPEEKKLEEKRERNLNSGDLMTLSEILFD
jgi:hypothetical protein